MKVFIKISSKKQGMCGHGDMEWTSTYTAFNEQGEIIFQACNRTENFLAHFVAVWELLQQLKEAGVKEVTFCLRNRTAIDWLKDKWSQIGRGSYRGISAGWQIAKFAEDNDMNINFSLVA